MENIIRFGEVSIEFGKGELGVIKLVIHDELYKTRITLELTDFEFGELVGSFKMLANH